MMGRRLAAGILVAIFAGPVAGPGPPSATLAAPQSFVVPALERYGRGDFDAALADLTTGRSLRDAARRFRDDAGNWLDRGRDDDRARRLRVVAAVAVELVARGVAGTFDEYEAVRPLAEWACERLRREPSTPFERVFHLAILGLQQATRDEESGLRFAHPENRHVRHAGGRFPEEPRFRLGWITSTRYETQVIASLPQKPGLLLVGTLDSLLNDDPPDALRLLHETAEHLGRLADDREVGDEARLRRGVLFVTIGQPAAGLADLRAAAESADPFVAYLGHVMLGVAAERMGRRADAIEHYAAAVRVVPATAATLGLAAALARDGRGVEAAAVVDAWAAGARVEDPWRWYSLRDYRLVPQHVAQLRAMVRP